MSFCQKKIWEECQPVMRDNGSFRLVLEFNALEDFQRFSLVAHGNRMTKLSEGQKNGLSFAEFEGI